MQNGEHPIILQNGLLHPRVKVEQRTHSGDEIEDHPVFNVLLNVIVIQLLMG